MLLGGKAPAQARANRLGLSIGLFCNSPRFAAKITPNQIVIREVQKPHVSPPASLEKARAQVQAAGYNGRMSGRTRAKVCGMLGEWFVAEKVKTERAFTTTNASARRFTFCTLTLCAAQMHSDNYLKRHGLARFIQECERHYGVNGWFWRAEPQKNGNIHFHILLAQSIPHEWVRSTWNKILTDLGYMAYYTGERLREYCNGFKPSRNPNDKRTIAQQVKAWKEGSATGWTNPNSTDIHRLQKVKNAAAYVCKYATKDGAARKIEGRIWGCTDTIRQLRTPEVGVTDEFIKCMNSAAKLGDVELIDCDYVAIYRGDIPALLAWLAPELLASLELYYEDVSEWLSTFVTPTTQ